jgi:hypothetical protein
VECCYQNVGIATSVALAMFNGQELNQAMGVPLFYGMCEAVFVGIYCIIGWKAGWSKAPSDVALWRMLFTSYEVLEAEKRGEALEIEVSFSSQGSKEHEDGHIFTTFFSMDEFPPSSPKNPSGIVDPASTAQDAEPTIVIV